LASLFPTIEELYYRRSAIDFIAHVSGSLIIEGEVSLTVEQACGGVVYVQGSAPYTTETSVGSGYVLAEGSAIRADSATVPVGGEVLAEGSGAREGESVIVVSGSVIIGGEVDVFLGFHYGWWPSDGFWPSTYGFWWDAEWSYEQQNGD